MNWIREKLSIAAQQMRNVRNRLNVGSDRAAKAFEAMGIQGEIATAVVHIKAIPRLLSKYLFSIVELERKTLVRKTRSSRRKRSCEAEKQTCKRVRKTSPEVAVTDGGKKPLLIKLPITLGLLFAIGIAFELLAGNNKTMFLLLGIPIKQSYLMALGAAMVVVALATAIIHFLSHTLIRNARRGKPDGEEQEQVQGPMVRNQFNRGVNLSLLLVTLTLAAGVTYGYGEVRADVIKTDAQAKGQKISKADLEKETLAFRILVAGEFAALILISLVLDPLPSQVIRKHRKAVNHDHRSEQRARSRENRAFRRMIRRGARLEVHNLEGPAKVMYTKLKNRADAAARGYLEDEVPGNPVPVARDDKEVSAETIVNDGKSIVDDLRDAETEEVADSADGPGGQGIIITPANNSNHSDLEQVD